MEEKEYMDLLKKARTELPAKVFETSRFNLPMVESIIQGKKTVINNINKIIDLLDRPQEHVIKYLAKELGTTGNMVGSRLILVGKFTPGNIGDKIRKYVEEFVKCSECGKPDTKLVKEGRITEIKCLACGAKRPIRTI